jgi:acyl-CoA synthetase (AMP-forming)/AMP-acid ligase II
VKTASDESVRPCDAVSGIEFSSFAEVLRHRAAKQPNDLAYVFLSDRGGERISLTFADLYARACAVAGNLIERGRREDRAVLLFPPGLDFIVAFLGCLLAGVIAVPLMVPRRDSSRDASAAILKDCSPRFAMTHLDVVANARPDLEERFRNARLDWIFVGAPSTEPIRPASALPVPGRGLVAFLQYTSGSTSEPKGVIVSHGNLLDNSEMIRIAFGNTRNSTYVSWVPLYHDMGLILNALQSLYVGSLCVLMAPVSFMQRPLSWLRAIHEYRAEVAGGPNFAFDLCVGRHRAEEMRGIDLSCWHVAFNGAEPVRANTITRFAETFAPYGFNPKSAHPAYGMAEATLMVSTGRRGVGPVTLSVSRDGLQRGRAAAPACAEDCHILVGCGRQLCGERVAIVEPEGRTPLPPGQVGEIWVTGPNVAQGYWGNSSASDEVFRAQVEGGGAEYWLRTGDLGFLDDSGELFITGRIKDLIIIRGINHYPQDIEETVQDCHSALRRHCGAVFTVLDRNAEEQLVVVQEVERTYRQQIDGSDIIPSVRGAIVREHDIVARQIVLIRPSTLPKTTSGKIQRQLTRQMFLAGTLSTLQ